MAKKNNTRVQLDFPEQTMLQLNELKSLTDATTNAEVMRNALMSYKWMVDHYQRGERLLLKSLSDDIREVELFGMKLMTLGNRRRQIVENLKAQSPDDLRIYEEEMYLAFPIENFTQAEASGLTGTHLIDKQALDEWLAEIGLHRKGTKLLQGDFGNRYIGLKSNRAPRK